VRRTSDGNQPRHPDRPTLWAVLPDTLSAIAAVLRSGVDLSAAAPEEHMALGPEAVTSVRTAAVESEETEEKGVAVLTLRGLITARASFLSFLFGGGAGLENFRAAFRQVLADENVTAIVLDIDSPGGSTDLVEETAAEIRAARGTKPIVAICNTMAASAAYYIASAADELVITPSGFAGSIGVRIVHWDYSAMNETIGIRPTYVTAGKFKAEGNEDEPLSDEAREYLQSVVDDFYGQFVAAVAAGRGVSEDQVRSGFGEGRVLTAQRAVDEGLADRIATFEEVLGDLLTPPATAADRAEAHARLVATLTAQQPVLMAQLAAAGFDFAGADAHQLASALATAAAAPPSDDPAGPEAEPASTTPPGDREEAPATPPWLLIPTPRH
jgi:signal peptide peptidase SppA